MIYGNSFLNIITEGSIYKDDKNNIMIGMYIDSNRNFEQDPYIKVFNNQNFNKATKVARISLKNVKYIYHSDRFDIWRLNSKEKKLLNEIIRSKDKNGNLIWNNILIELSKLTNKNISKIKIDIPDFTNLE